MVLVFTAPTGRVSNIKTRSCPEQLTRNFRSFGFSYGNGLNSAIRTD